MGRYVISEFNSGTGEVLGPHVGKFKKMCGFIVRDQVPISIHEWKKRGDRTSFVSDADKNLLWNRLVGEYFTIDTSAYTDVVQPDELLNRVRRWTMSRMGEAFKDWKKKTYQKYVKEGKTPNFEEGPAKKLAPYWEDFVSYQTSEEMMQVRMRNQNNFKKKQYHHTMGSGGYRSYTNKWVKLEQELVAKGVVPETINWNTRTKQWFFGHGGSIDPESGKVTYGKRIEEAHQRLMHILNEKAKGSFVPEREKDELSYAIGTVERGGRTRGLSGNIPWKYGFLEDKDSWRTLKRRKAAETAAAEEVSQLKQDLANSLAREKFLENNMQEEVRREVQRQLQLALNQHGISLESTAPLVHFSAPNPADDATLHFPVDDVTEPIPCELHIPNGNGTVKVADAIIRPNEDPTKTPLIHNRKVPPGYVVVGVDRVLGGFQDLPLDFEGGDEETTLGEVEKGVIVWRKCYIIIPAGVPKASAPPSPRQQEPTQPPSPTQLPPMRSPTPMRSPMRSPTPPPMPKPRTRSGGRGASSSSTPPGNMVKKLLTPRKKKSTVKKLPGEMTYEELLVESKKEVAAHFAKPLPKPPSPFSHLAPKELRKKVDEIDRQKRMEKPPSSISDYNRCLQKESERAKKQAGRGVPQLGEQSLQSIPPLVVDQYGSNTSASDILTQMASSEEVDFVEMSKIFKRIGLPLEEMDFPVADVVSTWQKFEHGKPLWDPTKESQLSTQMYLLHKWYIRACERGQVSFGVRVRQEHWSRGTDVMLVDFAELHQLFHMNDLDKTMLSICCL